LPTPTVEAISAHPLELAQDGGDHVGARRKRCARDELGEVGVDHLAALTPRQRDAMVPVDHEERPPGVTATIGGKPPSAKAAARLSQQSTLKRRSARRSAL
jgi:hypothetical protein